jgi:hypothetical protein
MSAFWDAAKDLRQRVESALDGSCSGDDRGERRIILLARKVTSMTARIGRRTQLAVSAATALLFVLGGILLTPTWGSGVCQEMKQGDDGEWIEVGEEWGPAYSIKPLGWPFAYALITKEGCSEQSTTVEWDAGGLVIDLLCAVGLAAITYLALVIVSRIRFRLQGTRRQADDLPQGGEVVQQSPGNGSAVSLDR